MKCEFEKAMEGIAKYISAEIYPNLNDVQEFAARVFVGRILNNAEYIKQGFMNNGFIRTFGVVDTEGMIDIYGIARDIKRELERSEKVTFNIPWFGKMTFKPTDVDVLYKTITGEEFVNYANN